MSTFTKMGKATGQAGIREISFDKFEMYKD